VEGGAVVSVDGVFGIAFGAIFGTDAAVICGVPALLVVGVVGVDLVDAGITIEEEGEEPDFDVEALGGDAFVEVKMPLPSSAGI